MARKPKTKDFYVANENGSEVKIKYYTLEEILKRDAHYNVIYGERSNGKTTAVLAYGLKQFIDSGYQHQMGIIRRMEEDFKGHGGSQLFEGINNLGWVKEWTKGEYNAVTYYARRWKLIYVNENGEKERECEQPLAYGFALTKEEHYKSTSFPYITTILFDEFMTRSYYLPNEFIFFQNILSTIIRLRTNVKIFMCANTINKYCPYFAEMGLFKTKQQEKGTIDLYEYGNSGLRVAVEYSDMPAKQKKSNVYFAFDNPKLKMITSGSWEISIYPHLPCKYLPKEVKYHYYINFDGELLECKVIYSDALKTPFTYIHRKTTPIREDNEQLVYQTEVNARRNYRTKITKPNDKLTDKIYRFYVEDNVFYQDNEVGEIVRNYLVWCKKEGV